MQIVVLIVAKVPLCIQFCDGMTCCSAEAAHREQAPEAEDRHTRESECNIVCHQTNQ